MDKSEFAAQQSTLRELAEIRQSGKYKTQLLKRATSQLIITAIVQGVKNILENVELAKTLTARAHRAFIKKYKAKLRKLAQQQGLSQRRRLGLLAKAGPKFLRSILEILDNYKRQQQQQHGGGSSSSST